MNWLDRLRSAPSDLSDGELVTRDALPLEQRAPSAATSKLQFLASGQPMVPEWDAEQAIRFAYMANVIVYRAVQVRAKATARLPFLVGPVNGDKSRATLDAPLARLLGPPPGGPAPKLSARRLWRWTMAQRDVTGRWAWEIEANPQGQIAALWPLTTTALKAIPADGGSEWFRAFTYGPPADPRRLRPDQVVYDWLPSQADFRQPEAPLQAARLPISVAVMGDRYNYGFLRNDARPAAVVVHQAFAESDMRDAFRASFLAEHQGPQNAGKVAFAEVTEGGDAKQAMLVQTLGLSHKDAQFLDTHKNALSEIAMALGVPWSMLDASGRTFDNASEETVHFWEDLASDLAEVADAINMQLAPRLSQRDVGWFDLSVVPALKKRPRFSAADGLMGIREGAVSRNEWRDEFDLPPVDGGDELLNETGGVGENPNTPQPIGEDEPEVVELEPARSRRDTLGHELRRASIWNDTDRQVRALERLWAQQWRGFFGRQERTVLNRLEGKRGRQVEQRADADALRIFDAAFWENETRDLARGLYDAVAQVAGGRLVEDLGFSFDVVAPFVDEFVEARANQLAGPVTETTYRAIQQAMTDGIAEGESIPDLAKRIRAVFDTASRTRSVTIARTEVISAYNGSAFTCAAQLPDDVVAGQEWIATRDSRTREAHASADGQVRGLGMAFDVGGSSMAYPGDPNGGASQTVNCRCTVAFLTPQEMAERMAERGRFPVDAAERVLARVRAGQQVDELALRRALRETRAA